MNYDHRGSAWMFTPGFAFNMNLSSTLLHDFIDAALFDEIVELDYIKFFEKFIFYHNIYLEHFYLCIIIIIVVLRKLSFI